MRPGLHVRRLSRQCSRSARPHVLRPTHLSRDPTRPSPGRRRPLCRVHGQVIPSRHCRLSERCVYTAAAASGMPHAFLISMIVHNCVYTYYITFQTSRHSFGTVSTPGGDCRSPHSADAVDLWPANSFGVRKPSGHRGMQTVHFLENLTLEEILRDKGRRLLSMCPTLEEFWHGCFGVISDSYDDECDILLL